MSGAGSSFRQSRREKKKDFKELYSFEAFYDIAKRLKFLEETVALKDEEIQHLKTEVSM